MAYQEFWQPIQNAFSQINQNINTVADRNDRRAAQGLQNLMSLDTLSGRHFERKQQEASALRAERQLDMEQQNMSFNQALREKEMAMAERQEALLRPIRERDAAIARMTMQPREVNMYSLVPKELLDDPASRTAIASAMGGKDASINNQGILSTPLTGLQMQQRLPGLMGVITSYGTPDQRIGQEMATLQERMDYRKKEIDRVPKGVHERVLTRKLDMERAQKEDQKRLDALQNMPRKDLIAQYEQRQHMLENMAIQYAQAGGDANSPAGAVMINAFKENSDRLKNLYDERAKDLTAGGSGKGELKKAGLYDKNGTLIKSKWVTVGKGLGKGVEPVDLDEDLEGYKWDEGNTYGAKGKDSGQWTSGVNRINMEYGTSANGLTWEINPEFRELHNMTLNAYEHDLKEAEDKGVSMPQLVASNKALLDTKADYQTYNDIYTSMATGLKLDPEDPKEDRVIREEVADLDIVLDKDGNVTGFYEEGQELAKGEKVAKYGEVFTKRYGFLPAPMME